MKKAKLIIPAIAILAVSGAASVTGTVAWFTAANSTDFNVSKITAVSLDSSLIATVDTDSALINCKAVTGGGVEATNNVTDASYDVEEDKLYRAAFDNPDLANNETFNDPDSYYGLTGLNPTFTTSDGKIVGYCVSWTEKFTSNVSGGNVDLYFSFENSTATCTNGLSGAYRLAAICGTHKFVWAPNTTATNIDYVTAAGEAGDDTEDKYVNTTEATVKGVKGDSVDNATYADGKTDARKNAGYLGEITEDGLSVKFVIWVEGMDPATVNKNVSGEFSSKLAFYGRNVDGYAA